MLNSRTQPPWEFLLSASRNSLQSYELSRLSHAANLRKEIAALVDQWVEENSAAMLARWLMEHREQPARGEESMPIAEAASGRHYSASDNFLTDRGVPEAVSRGAALGEVRL
ncbi:MAG: hypothetical protein PVS2B2_02340 [Candidatus Acidiferrum sp.]